jgi:hypothetical protein
MKNILGSSNLRITKWCVALTAVLMTFATTGWGQTPFDTFSDSNFTANPTWGGSTTAWGIQANSDVAAGATGSNTLRLASIGGTTVFLSSQVSSWGDSQEWGVWIGRRAQAFTAANQAYFWLVANESTLNNATVDGYRLAIGDDTGGDEIRLEYVVNGVVSATVITSSGSLANGLTDIGFLVRVTRSSSGAWALFTSTLPTANGGGAIATGVPNSTNANVSQGTATHNTLVPASNNFIGVAALHSTGASAIVSTEFDQIYFTPASAVTAPIVASSPATDVAGTTATLNGNVTADGGATVTQRGFVYNTSSPVTINDNKTIVSGTTGAFSNNVSSLTTGATYYFRAYASNSVGVTLSSEQNFTTGAIAGPTLIPATLATVDTAFEVTFPDDATWRGVISGVKLDGVALTGGYAVSSGKITFTPSSSVPTAALQSPGTKSITVSATGYNDATVSQNLGAGQASKLVITTQPTAPSANGGALAAQPVVALQDQYGNATASTANVTAAAGAGTWTLGGTATVAAVNGTATFSGLTATSAAAVTGATISFSSGSLGAVSSAAFNLAAANELQLAAVGTAVTQNFDSLASTGNSSLMPLGWFFVETGSSGNTTYAPGTGSSNSGNTYSFGAEASTERALGGLQSGSVMPVIGAKIRNTTGATLTDLAISYVGEQWRLGASGRPDRLDFEFSTNATSLSDGTWTPVPSLNFTAPISTGTVGALNGNDAANRVAVNGTVQNLSLANGAALWIRWVDFNASGADDGLGIDDFSVTGSVNAVAAPQFALAGGDYLSNQVVKIANFAALDGAGATVYYTVDGSTPTASSTPYNNTDGVALTAGNGSITVQAVAIKGADVSSVASANYHLPKDVANLTALRASAAGSTIYRVTGEVTFTAGTTFRNTKFFQDVGAGIQIDDVGGILTTPYLAGDNVRNIVGKIALFNGQLQMVPLQDFGPAVSSGNVVTPLSRTLATLTDDDQARLVTISGVEYQGADGTLVFTTATATINTAVRDSSTGATYSGWVRNIFSDSDVTGKVIPTGAVTVTGIVQKTLINSVQSLTVGPRNSAEVGADTIKPGIALIGDNPLLLANGATYTDPGATVTDNVDAERTITGSGTVNTTAAGDYTITYNASDAAGNAAIAVTRTVRVAAPLGTTYSGWLGQAGASDAAFLDYVFGAVTPGTLDPSLRPTVAVTGGNLVLTYYVRQGTSGLTVTPKTSADLAAGPSGWVTTDVTVVDVGAARSVNGVTVQQKTASVPVSGAKKFLRVEAIQQ